MKRKLIITILILQIISLFLIISDYEFLLPALADNYDILVYPGESIQEAINNASEGQTICIRKGIHTIDETIIVNKTITLLGESVNETIIDGHGEVTTILNVLVSRVEIQNLTIRKSDTGFHLFAGIQIKDALNVKILNCHARNCATGVILTNSTQCELRGNLIADNTDYGIYFTMEASYNTIFWNNIKNNSQAISIGETNCKKNVFIQNNFVDNTDRATGFGVPANIWNATYPTGGNYWSDYTYDDGKSGVYQNETGSDGVGDEPCELYLGASDHYPIMGPIRWFHAYGYETTDYYTLVSSNVSDASGFYFDSNEAFINFTLTGDPEAGFCRVAIPKQLLWVEDGWLLFIDDEITEHTIMSDMNYTCICFAYDYSDAKTIKVQGTHCIPEFSSLSILLFVVATMIAFVMFRITKTNASLLGDLKEDCYVDLYDAVGLLQRYGTKEGNPSYDEAYDIAMPYTSEHADGK